MHKTFYIKTFKNAI